MTEDRIAALHVERHAGVLRGRASVREQEAHRLRQLGLPREADLHDDIAASYRRMARHIEAESG